MARIGHVEEGMRSSVVQALGGFLVPSRNTLMLFCRDIFEYPELEGHDLLCNHLGKGRESGGWGLVVSCTICNNLAKNDDPFLYL